MSWFLFIKKISQFHWCAIVTLFIFACVVLVFTWCTCCDRNDKTRWCRWCYNCVLVSQNRCFRNESCSTCWMLSVEMGCCLLICWLLSCIWSIHCLHQWWLRLRFRSDALFQSPNFNDITTHKKTSHKIVHRMYRETFKFFWKHFVPVCLLATNLFFDFAKFFFISIQKNTPTRINPFTQWIQIT